MGIFVAIATCAIELTRSRYWCSMQYGDICNFTSFMRHFSFRIHRKCNNNVWPCIDVRLLNVWNGCRVGPERTARTFVAIAACAIDLTRSCYWCSMQYGMVYNFTSYAILLSEYTATLIMALH